MILEGIGLSMLIGSVIKMYRILPSRHLKTICRRYLDDTKHTDVKIVDLRRANYGYDMTFLLPLKTHYEDFEDTKTGLSQACECAVDYLWEGGKFVIARFGLEPIQKTVHYDKDKKYPPLTVPLMTPFGEQLIDFNDGSTPHLLVGGATRMGKSVLLQITNYSLLKHGYDQVQIAMISNKISDFFPFKNIPHISLHESQTECLEVLNLVRTEAAIRKQMMHDADASELSEVGDFQHWFIIIDEYARFADNEQIQEIVTWIAETAGYLNIHLVIASQRPDAQTVLKPRIKGNLMTRMCFKTADEMNSRIVLDNELAAKLPLKKGRAVLLDGMYYEVQTPYLTAFDIKSNLKEYAVNEPTRRKYPESTEIFQGSESETIGAIVLPKSEGRKSNRKSRTKKT